MPNARRRSPEAHRRAPDAPKLEIISDTDETNRAELIALPASRHRDRRRALVLHQVVSERGHADHHAPFDEPPRSAA